MVALPNNLVPCGAFLLNAPLSCAVLPMEQTLGMEGEMKSSNATPGLTHFRISRVGVFSLPAYESGHLGIKHLREDGQNSGY